jgi:hypothetical protein
MKRLLSEKHNFDCKLILSGSHGDGIFVLLRHGISIIFYIRLYNHSLLRYDGQESRQTSKPQNSRLLFDVELYFTVHKSFVSTSLNIFIVVARFILVIPIGQLLHYTKIQ